MATAAVLRPRQRATSLADIAARADASVDSSDASVLVTGITHDSRQVQRGDLYAALPGAHVHGAAFAADVAAAGAVAVLTDAAGAALMGSRAIPKIVVGDVRRCLGPVSSLIYGDPSHHLDVIGVTGTNGKTTTTWLIEGALRAAGITTAVIGTAGVRLGTEIVPSARTTPEAPDLQALLAYLLERGASVVAMEVSSHALEFGRVDGTRFAVVGFTHLTQDHLDFHHTMQNYFEAKARLFTTDFAASGVVVIDDEWGRALAERTELPVCTVSTQSRDATWTLASAVTVSPGGQRFTAIKDGSESFDVELRLAGPFNVANALLALALIDTLDVPLVQVARGLAQVDVPGRMQRIEIAAAPLGIVDYAHTPDAVARAVAAAADLGRRLVVVVGAGGDRDAEKRPLMGAAAAGLADVVVITDDNPRSEDPAAIRGSVAAGAHGGRATVVEVADRRAAIAYAVRAAGSAGLALVLGKGHETGQEVGGVMHPFDDRVELQQALIDFAADAGRS